MISVTAAVPILIKIFEDFPDVVISVIKLYIFSSGNVCGFLA